MGVRGQFRRWAWMIALAILSRGPTLGAQAPAGTRDSPAGHEIRGRAVYDQVVMQPVVTRPIVGAAVLAFDPASGARAAAGVTDEDGRFALEVDRPGVYRVRVAARLGFGELVVRNNADGNRVWSVSGDARTGEPVLLRASDESRAAGAFNIFETIRRANAFVRELEAGIELPPISVFWSPLNTSDPLSRTGVFVGGTYFDAGRGLAVVLGDREIDSDEFDDHVILHEYAHFLAARFSGDHSMGGPHVPGDVLDPRVAWSEGWANFFSALVTGDPVYRDTRGPDPNRVLRYDLEVNPAGFLPGYWSEATVHALLWDLSDSERDLGETAQVDPRAIWSAFRGLVDDAFVYLPSFLDRLAFGGAIAPGALEQLARIHSLDYVVGTRRAPTFPKFLDGRTATGEVDSFSTRRVNLARSAHLYRFRTSGGAVTIELEITGPGRGGNARANDLDLLLMDEAGRLLRTSESGGNGARERIATFLPEGDYVVEVRSFSARGPGNGNTGGEGSFNSGAYRLTINRP